MFNLSGEEKSWIDEIWNKLDSKLSKTAIKSYDKLPYTSINGTHDDRSGEEGIDWWTNGFWPALMILMYDATKNEQYLKTARHGMDKLDELFYSKIDALHHDVGFMWNISSGADYRITGDKKERNRFLLAANTLMGRYNDAGKYICAWNGEDKKGWAIIDCMMNIPLLYRASEETKDDRFKMVAMNHADTTMKFHVRADGSCNHVNEYDYMNGGFVTNHTGQGYGEYQLSSWSRGQAWALYGFVLSYIFTKKTDYLDTAKRVAHYFIANVCTTDWIPLCDFRAPETPVIYDSTAGACAACGLLEIANSVNDLEKNMYISAAINILKALEKKCCNWEDNEDAILLMGTERYGYGEHMPIIYGDYFFAEAIYKLKGFKTLFW